MASRKLNYIEIEEDFRLIGIHSQLEAYKLAFNLNKSLKVCLKKFEYKIEINKAEFIFEQFKRGVPRNQVKGKGLPSANKIASDIIYEEKVTGGFGQKIADFIDSGYKKNTRSIMGNDPSMPPFVIDIHSARDFPFPCPPAAGISDFLQSSP